jgi:predicted ATPase/DNA-binding SARP family transcriptional activator
MLAVHRGSVVSTERLCEELWGNDQPADPAGVLQSHVSRLRRILRPDSEIMQRPPGYVLQIADDAIDAGRFEALCRLADAASDPKTVVELLDEALGCWRGVAFEEFSDLDWAQRESVRLDELRANAQENLFDARLELGAHAASIGELEALVVERPLRERLWSQLMIALYRSGRSAEALRRAAAFRSLLREELGLDPSPAFRELEARVLTDDPTLMQAIEVVHRPQPRRLPVERTALLGRDDAVCELVDHVRRARLVTLTGPGGVGKTRLAMRLAQELWDEYAGEVVLAELAPVHDPASTVAAIATAVDVQQRQQLSIEESIVEYLRGRRTLLLLDNCEHVREIVASLTEQLLSWCPDVTVVATSREVLGLPGELVYRVQPLGLPDPTSEAATASENAAVRLFVERAGAAQPGFALGADNIDDIVQIVRRLDGVPLAIELAAARMRAMSPSALAARLGDSFDLLAGAQTSMIERHRTLQDLVAWSHDLLAPAERRLFAQLSVFAGGFGLDAAEAVCATDLRDRATVSVLLANLVDKSMVQLVDASLPRYRVLETLREYGGERLDDVERAELRARHGCWYLEVAEDCSQMLSGPFEPAAVTVLERDFDNLRAAHRWTLEQPNAALALRLVAALREFAFRCMRAEVMSWAEAAAAHPDAPSHDRFPLVLAVVAEGKFGRGDVDGALAFGERAIAEAERLGVDTSGLAERALGNALFYKGDAERATEWGNRMVTSARHGSPARLAHALYMRSVAYCSVGAYAKGAQLAGEARAAAIASGSPTAQAQAFYALGIALEPTNPVEARAHLQRATDVASAAGNRWIQAFALTEVLWREARDGRPREALARYGDVIELWYRGGEWANQWLSLRHLFGILVQLRAYLAAATLHGALRSAGAAYALPFTDAEVINALEDELREHLGEATFDAAVRRGASLRDAEVIEFVRTQIDALSGIADDQAAT